MSKGAYAMGVILSGVYLLTMKEEGQSFAVLIRIYSSNQHTSQNP